ncbi:hypothetical protein GCM10010840_33880 [Deinococcus aerolatus]|uniref:Type I restriction modification DNA specificity domain-containing protein n=1 Tax=Deinococcus aerolatus TaxID=522487 RepID=A0ABQ2GF60_9DEIO|nr:restriction endonuclease subunit S [Deinococcus aerolatus]GGL93013.1 hypothetical protein GCM10010840_33880 [Deinococcus aerolatus]
MIHALTPYPAMKDSGVPWLGQVPEHWDVVPALAAYKSRGIKNTGMVEKTVLSLSYGRIVIKPEEKLRGLVPESFETYQIVEPGNIIVRTTDLQNDKNSLRIGHAKDRGIITSAYLCLETTDRVLNEFGYQYLNAYDLLKIIYGYGSGLRQNLDFKDIRRMPVLVPSHDEQAAIVRYLDYADRRIRRTIAAKQKLIKLLQEQKQVIIHQAVTRGLDPDVKLKPSGVEWLGNVPEGWKVKRLKAEMYNLNPVRVPLSSTERGRMTTREYDYYGASGIIDKVDDYLFDDDLLLIAEDGANLVLRNLPLAVIARGKFWVNNHAHILKPIEGKLEYFAAVLEQINYLPWITGSAQPKLTRDRLMAVKIPVPPVDEQEAITEAISNTTLPLSSAIQRTQQEISLLREYRTRLIADLVTGKLDVRGVAAQLPELDAALPEEELDVEIDTDLEGDEPETEAAEALA